jgi:type III secretory pathway component EscS
MKYFFTDICPAAIALLGIVVAWVVGVCAVVFIVVKMLQALGVLH